MSNPLVALPIVGYFLIWWLVTNHRDSLGLSRLSWRGTAVAGFLAFQAALVLVTEGLSVGGHLTHATATSAWFVADVAAFVLLVSFAGARALGAQVQSMPSTVAGWVRRRRIEELVACACLVAIVLVLAITAWRYLPNNADSLVYHLARVAHWQQESSVAHFATHYTTQIEWAPLHEFNMLHVHLLTGSDRLDGFVQLAAYCACAVGAAEIARLLGAAAAVQVAAALIFALVPSAILEAGSTQNNVFAAACGVGSITLLLAWIPLGRCAAVAAMLGVGTGLAILAKGTLAALIGGTMLFLAGHIMIVERRLSSWGVVLRRLAVSITIVLACAVVVAAPFLKRNHDLFGTFTGPVSDTTINTDLSIRDGLGNVVRSVAVNFRVGGGRAGPDTIAQHVALGGLEAVYDIVGASPDDSRYVMGVQTNAFERADYRWWARLEEYGANPWHVVLIGVSGVVLLTGVVRSGRPFLLPALLALGLTIGFIALAGTARWSVFVSRYYLPLLTGWAALIAIALAHVHRWVLAGTVVLLLVAAMPQLLDNAARSLLHQRSNATSDLAPYFFWGENNQDLLGPSDYVAARDAIVDSGCRRLGIANWILLEYPLWAGLDNTAWTGEIEHVDVSNASAALQDTEFQPCALIRQTSDRAPVTSPPGWTEVAFGDLAVSFAPEHHDEPATAN